MVENQFNKEFTDLALEAEVNNYEMDDETIKSVFDKPLYREIINTRAFKRLKKIHFLGSIDFILPSKGSRPNKRHTRYQHSLCVARLALEYSRIKMFSDQEESLAVAASLLHDIGHAPLSHSLESVFKEKFSHNHHISGDRIIRGENDLGQGLYKVLTKYKLNPFEIGALISGHGSSKNRATSLFKYAINIDTIEGILRSSTYLYTNDLFFSKADVLNAFISCNEESIKVLDRFWALKNEVYSSLIQSKQGIIADYLCQKYMREHIDKFSEADYLVNEDVLKQAHSEIFRQLRDLGDQKPLYMLDQHEKIDCSFRTFFVKKNVQLKPTSLRSLDQRYTQTKKITSKNLRKYGNLDFENIRPIPQDSGNLQLF